MHDARTVASGVELIMGEGRFVAPRTVEIALNDCGSRRIFGERVFLVLGSRARCRRCLDSPLETTAANVWAMGDCAGSPHFTHAAYNDFVSCMAT